MKKQHVSRRLLAILLALSMCISLLPVTAMAAGEEGTLVTSADEITAGGQFVLVAKADEKYYALPTASLTGKPTGVEVAVEDNTVTAMSGSLPKWRVEKLGDDSVSLHNGTGYLGWTSSTNFASFNTAYQWNVSGGTDNLFTFTANSSIGTSSTRTISWNGNAFGTYATGQSAYNEKLLVFKTGEPAAETQVATPTASPAGGTTVVPGTTVTLSCGTTDVTYQTSVNSSDWDDLTGNTFEIPADATGTYAVSVRAIKEGLAESEVLELEYPILDTSNVSTIAKARAGSTGDMFTVSGTVTFIDGNSVYIQDETAGIDLYCKEKPSGISRGDTVVAYGTHNVFNGLVELDAAEIVSSTSGTLPAPKEITIAQINESVESQLIKVVGAKVTKIDGTTITLSQGEGDSAATTTIYKSPTKDGLTVGDTITVTAVVSRYNAFQLRVNSADDIVITDHTEPDPGPDDPTPPTPTGVIDWEPVEWADIVSGGTYVITMTRSDGTFALPNDGAAGSNRSADSVTPSGSTLSADAGKYGWTFAKSGDGFTISANDLYLAPATGTANGTRMVETATVWTLDAASGYLSAHNGTAQRYMGVYVSGATKDWRTYTSATQANIANQTLTIWAPAAEGTEPNPSGSDAPKDGAEVVMYNIKSGKVPDTSLSSGKFAGVDATVSGSKLNVNGQAMVMKVETKNEDDKTLYAFKVDGKYLSSTTSGTFTLETEATNGSWWELRKDGEGWYILTAIATYGSNKDSQLGIEYFGSNFTPYYSRNKDGAEALGDAFRMQFYAKANVTMKEPDPGPDVPDEPGEELYKPIDGDKVAIYYPKENLVLTGTPSSSNAARLVGVNVPVSGGMLFTGEALILTATVDSDGYYTFTTSDGRVLNTGAGGNSLTLVAAADAVCSKWEVTAATKGDGWLIRSTTAEYSGNKNQYIEYYSPGFTTYSLKDGADQGIYTMLFYPESSIKTINWTVDDEIEQTIAQWGGGKVTENAQSISGDLLAIGDELDTSSTFTVWKNGVQTVTHTTGSGNHYVGGTGLGATAKDYFLFTTSSAGWGGMELSFRMYLTGTAPKSWRVQFSTDGENFADFGAGSYTASYTPYTSSGQGETVTVNEKIVDGLIQIKDTKLAGVNVSYTLSVPVGAENAEHLYIRLLAGNENINGGTVSSNSGNSRIDTVKLVGSPVVSDSITPYVTIEPEDTEDVGSGAEITLTGSTGATVHYGWANNETGAVAYTTGNTATVPAELPATLFFYASSAGKADSVVRKMTYRPSAVSSVQMNPNGGGVYLASASDKVEVELTTATVGATILYNLSTWTKNDDGSLKYEEYIPGTTKITLNSGFGTLTVSAYAKKEGFSDSAVTTRTFTERASEKYQLFFGQMHSHTSYSDGAGTAAQAFSSVKALDQETWNMDFLSVTDHSNSFDDAGESKKLADAPTGQEWNEGKRLATEITDSGFVGIFGYEMTWSNGLGHMNTFNTPGYQDRTQDAYKTYSTALQNYYAELKTVPTSISQFNHPGTTFGDFTDFAYYDEEIDQLITLIEVGNGEGAIGSSGYFPSYEYYTRALDKGWHVAPTNNQDNHKGGWGTANTGRDVVLVDELTEAAIYDAMRNYRVYATEDLNLEIYYTFDGQIMGSILDADSYADKAATISVDLKDPNNEKATTVQVIVNGGKVLTQKENVTCNETVTFEIEKPADYAYYYIKIVQGDGDIAVTAPVWVGAVEAVGITSLTAEKAITIAGEEQTFNLELFNNEKTPLEVTSIVFTQKETGKVLHTATDVTRVPKMGTASTSFTTTFTTDGIATVLATVRGTIKGVEKVYTQELELNVMPQNLVKRIVVDGSHYNDYVTGYYGGNMGNMTTIAAGMGVEVIVAREITAELLEKCELLVVSAPARKSGTANAGDYTASLFEDSFIDLVKSYVKDGGNVVVCGLADYQDRGGASDEHQISVQINKLLVAIGSTMTINDDEAYDEVKNGGQAYRLYPEIFNMDSNWCKGIITVDKPNEYGSYQTYSQYSGCTVNPGDGTWLVKGFDTTYSIDSDGDGNGGIAKGEGPVYFLACEETPAGGTIFAAGGVFLSDFEVKAELDNIFDLPYANRTIFENILGMVREDIQITPIAETRKAPLNKVFAIEGYVTSGTTNPNTTFFDSIYVQDATGGTDVFPYATAGLAIGTKVRVLGYTDAYQGDREIQVINLEILDDEPYVYEPTGLTTAQATDYGTYGGLLVSVTGKVSDIVMAGGRVSQFKVTDSSDKAATVFIDGYITNPDGVNDIHTWLKDGQTVSAVGLLYSHPEGDSDVSVPVLRVRNCDEITKVSDPQPPVVPDPPVIPDVPVVSPPVSSGGSSSGTPEGGNTTQPTEPSLPVSTGTESVGNEVVTETTAVIESKTDGTTASAAVSEEIAQEIVNQAVRNDSDAVVIAPDMGSDVTKATVSIPASTVAEIAEKTDAEIRVETPVADVTIPNEGLSDLAKAGGEVTVSVERSGSMVEVTIEANGKQVDKVTGGVMVSIPQENCTPGTVAMLVHEDGTTEVVRQSIASSDGHSIAVPLDGSAKVVIVDNSVSFRDVSSSNWAADAVAFASSHELMNGTGDGIFDPNASMTRGMLATVLHNLDNNPSVASGTGFADVADDAWYADAVAWAAATGVITGYSDGRFGPNNPITREQLAVMLYRYAGSPAVNASTLNFVDAGDISSYAETAIAWAVANGILHGKGGGILDPKGTATRAEVAQMLLNFVSSMV